MLCLKFRRRYPHACFRCVLGSPWPATALLGRLSRPRDRQSLLIPLLWRSRHTNASRPLIPGGDGQVGCLLLDVQATESHSRVTSRTGFPVGHQSVRPSAMSFLQTSYYHGQGPCDLLLLLTLRPREGGPGRQGGRRPARPGAGWRWAVCSRPCVPDHGSAPTSPPTLGIITPTSLREFPPNSALSEMMSIRLFFEGWVKLASKNLWTNFINQPK